jgi:hypothetical protein
MLSRADCALAQCQWTSGSGTITQTCGSVGIGTTNPANSLHVVGTSNTNAIFEGGASTHSAIQFRNAGNSRGYFGFANQGSTGFAFWDAAGSAINLLLTDAGKLGLGTQTPYSKLSVVPGTSGRQIAIGDWTDFSGSWSGYGLFGGNMYQDTSFTGLRYSNTHGSIGAVGFAVNYPNWNQATIVSSGTTTSTAGTSFTPIIIAAFDYTGKVGIGTTAPNRLLHIRDTSATSVFTGARISTSIDGSDPAYELLHETANKGFRWRLGSGSISNLALDYTTNAFIPGSNSEYITVLSTGNVGIGNTNPLTRVHVGAGSAPPITAGSTLLVENGVATSAVIKSTSGGEMFVYQDANNGTLGTATTHPLGIRTNNINRIWIEANGNVGIGTMSPQNALDVNGTISGTNVIAKYQDVAEWVPASRAMPAGTVVTLDPEHSNLVVASSHSYDTRVAGVVSEKPGVILGEGGEGKVMVATTGRVRVKVDATNGPIRVGDLLVTSDKEGIAMRSQPLDLGGTPIHRPGTLIGKALEPLEKGVGEILVLLSLQ